MDIHRLVATQRLEDREQESLLLNVSIERNSTGSRVGREKEEEEE